MLEVLHVPTLVDNYVWLIREPNSSNTIIVDPGEAWPVQQKLQSERLNPVAILVTHYHYDHTGGLGELAENYDIPIFGPGHIRHITQPVQDGDLVSIDGLKAYFSVLDVRGHTFDHIAYTTDKLLFCGDVIFSGGCGRLFDGTIEHMARAVARLASFPEDTVVYCAHEYTVANLKFAAAVEPGNTAITKHAQWAQEMRQQGLPTLPTTIGKEKQINPFLRVDQPDVIRAVKNKYPDISNNPLQVFTALRRWKDGFRG